MSNDFLERMGRILSDASVEELRKLRSLAYAQAERKSKRDTPPQFQGKPQDALVQRLAGYALTVLHSDPPMGEGMSLNKIAEMFEASPQRVGQLWHRLVGVADEESVEPSAQNGHARPRARKQTRKTG